jgi:hypothetical protein
MWQTGAVGIASAREGQYWVGEGDARNLRGALRFVFDID